MGKWYVIQVKIGSEEKIMKACSVIVSKQSLQECFLPKFKRMKKTSGSWDEVEEILFSGYIFMISNDVNLLFQELKQIPDLTKVLGKHGQDIFPIAEDEIIFLKSFGAENHTVNISVGYIEGDKIVVMQGPLKGKEGLIRRVDRHKRLAYIDLEFMGNITRAKVGLEIISKK